MNFGVWEDFAKLDIDSVISFILSDRHTIQECNPDLYLFKYIGCPSDSLSILDFGCGIGRNSYGMANLSNNWKITGYDNVYMINHSIEYRDKYYGEKEFPNVEFCSDWDVVKNKTFDVILSTLVLQHLSKKDMECYVKDFKKMASKLVVVSRTALDFEPRLSTWDALESFGCVPVEFYTNTEERIEYIPTGHSERHNIAIYEFN